MSNQTPVKLSDLEDALLFVDADGFDTAAWVCRATGAVLWHSEEGDWEPVPADIDDPARYVAVPGKHDLGLLGKPLALEFTRTQLPACYEQVRAIFSRRGAYGRFKDLLDRHDSLDAWQDWEAEQTRQALRAWCVENGLTLAS